MLLLILFVTFFIIGLVSFGGGYAMIPLIQTEVVERRGWMSPEQFTEAIAAAGMAPGPIASNSAMFVGYEEAGAAGALVASLGVLLPSLLVIVVISAYFDRIYRNPYVKAAFYTLRAVITGMIAYSAWMFADKAGMLGGEFGWKTLLLLGLFGASLFALIRLKMHPLIVILLSGLISTAVLG